MPPRTRCAPSRARSLGSPTTEPRATPFRTSGTGSRRTTTDQGSPHLRGPGQEARQATAVPLELARSLNASSSVKRASIAMLC
eukprot:scaffold795_cov375-Prasinococcus_capsulatus_cf.AAC.21